jgi:hypothetical protein
VASKLCSFLQRQLEGIGHGESLAFESHGRCSSYAVDKLRKKHLLQFDGANTKLSIMYDSVMWANVAVRWLEILLA